MFEGFFDFIFIVIYGGLLAQAVPALAADPNVLVAGNTTYGIVDIEWNVLVNNTHNMTVTGTVQDVLNSIQQVDPASAAAIHQLIQTADTAASSDLNQTATDIAPPHEMDYIPAGRVCDVVGWADAGYDDITTGITYLNHVPGKPTAGPGHGQCARVSCSDNSAIWWCNDNSQTKNLDSFAAIAAGAKLVRDNCMDEYEDFLEGQQFYEDGWNVIVNGVDC